MSIKKKLINAFCLLLLLSIITTSLYYFLYFKYTLSDLERKEINETIEKLENFINYEKERLLGITRNWSVWTDAWLFIQGLNPNFKEINLGIETYTTNKINLIAYLDWRGNIRTGGFYDTETKKIRTLEDKILRKYIQKYLSLTKRVGYVGIAKENDYSMIIAAHPVVKSDYRGPVVGYLLMGKVITTEMENHIKGLFGLSTFKIITAESLPDLRVDKEKGIFKVTYKIEDFFEKKNIALYFESVNKTGGILKESLIFLAKIYFLLMFAFSIFVFFIFNKKILNRIDRIVDSLHEIRRKVRDNLEIDEKDEIGYLIGEINDFWESIKKSTLESQKNEKIFKSVSDKVEELIIVIDSEGKIIYANPKAQSFIKTSEKLKYIPYKIAALSDEQIENEEEVELEDKRYLRLKKFIVQEKPKIILIIGEDITLVKKERERLMEIAIKDELTSLYNRIYFEKALKEKVDLAKMGEKYSLIFATVENLKEINEENGRVVGDFVVKSISKAILTSIKPSDIAARWSGSKFAIILRGELLDAMEIEEKIKKLTEVTLELDGKIVPLKITTKTTVLDGKKDPQTLIREAISN